MNLSIVLIEKGKAMRLPLEKIIRYESEDGIHVKAMDRGELVRCKDCKWWYKEDEENKCLEFADIPLTDEDFCSHGERKDDETD